MSSIRRGCTSECFYSTGPASACTCACGGEHHGKGAETTNQQTEVQTVGGQAFIPASGADSQPAEHTPEQQAELDRNAELAALDAEAADAEREAQDLRRRAGEHIDHTSAMAAHLRTGATSAENRAKAARRKARELRGEPELESERITREAFARDSITADDLRASREALAREAEARKAAADNTLAWNPATQKVEGTYRGHEMTAGRGTAYQFQVGQSVYTAHWTGTLRDGEPEFRGVDDDTSLSARHATWFMPLSEVTPGDDETDVLKSRYEQALTARYATQAAGGSFSSDDDLADSFRTLQDRLGLKAANEFSTQAGERARAATNWDAAMAHPLAGSPEAWTGRTFTLDNFPALDGDDRRVNLPPGRYTVESFTPNRHMPDGGLATLRAADGGAAYRAPVGVVRISYNASVDRRAGQNVVDWELAEHKHPGSGGNLADQIALGNHATDRNSSVRQAAVRAVADRLGDRGVDTGAGTEHTNAQARLMVTGGRTSSPQETTATEESLALDAARAYLDQHARR